MYKAIGALINHSTIFRKLCTIWGSKSLPLCWRIYFFASASEHNAGDAHLFAGYFSNVAGTRAEQILFVTGLWQTILIVDHDDAWLLGEIAADLERAAAANSARAFSASYFCL